MKNFKNKVKIIYGCFDKLLKTKPELHLLVVEKYDGIQNITTTSCSDTTGAEYAKDIYYIYSFLLVVFEYNNKIKENEPSKKVKIDDKLIKNIMSFFLFVSTKTTISYSESPTGDNNKRAMLTEYISSSLGIMISSNLIDQKRCARYFKKVEAINFPKKTFITGFAHQFNELKSRVFYKLGRFSSFIQSKISQAFTNNINKNAYMNQPEESLLASSDDNHVSLLVSKENNKTSVLSMYSIAENDFEVVYKDEMDVKFVDVSDCWVHISELTNIQHSKPELLNSINDIDAVLSPSSEESSTLYVTSSEEDGFEVVSKDEIHPECEREEDGFEVVNKDEIHPECEQEEDGFEVVNMPSCQAAASSRSFSISTRIQSANSKLYNIQSVRDCKIR